MSYRFLSDEWFAKVEELTAEVNPEIPPAAADLKLNITVTGDEGNVAFSIVGGKMEKGHVEQGSLSISLPMDLARKMFIDRDQSSGMQAFLSGKMKIQGDMNKMMVLQNVKPTESQEVLTARGDSRELAAPAPGL